MITELLYDPGHSLYFFIFSNGYKIMVSRSGEIEPQIDGIRLVGDINVSLENFIREVNMEAFVKNLGEL